MIQKSMSLEYEVKDYLKRSALLPKGEKVEKKKVGGWFASGFACIFDNCSVGPSSAWLPRS